jgi:hypothetical protein
MYGAYRHGGSFRIRVRDALRATTAAPTFFSPLETEDAKYCDGAFLANNPTAVALNEVLLTFTHRHVGLLRRCQVAVPVAKKDCTCNDALYILYVCVCVYIHLQWYMA